MKSDGIVTAVQFVGVFWAATPYNVADGCECPYILSTHIIFIFLHNVSTHHITPCRRQRSKDFSIVSPLCLLIDFCFYNKREHKINECVVFELLFSL